MHIPDGFISTPFALAMDGLSGAAILYAARRVGRDLADRLIPLMGVLSAFVFAAQLLNFPVLGGTSGHLVGGALLGILLGPMAALLTMATVVIAQALILQDGGLIALGANIFNIGAVTSLSGYLVFRLLAGEQPGGQLLAVSAFVAGWLSTIISASCCALELAFSGPIPLRVAFPAMSGYYALIGLVEGGLTAGALTFLSHSRPDLIKGRIYAKMEARDWIGVLAFVALPIVLLIMGGSSRLPDPLQRLLRLSLDSAPGGHAAYGAALSSGLLIRVGASMALILVVIAAYRWIRRRAGR